MSVPPHIYQRLEGTKADGTASAEIYVCKVLGRVSRTIGINTADQVQALVPLAVDDAGPRPEGCADAWPPADWDLAKDITLEFGLITDAGVKTQTVRIEGLRLLQQDPALWGISPLDASRHAVKPDVTSEPHGMVLTLAPISALWGDGRGGLIKPPDGGVFNILRADGTFDPAASTSRTNSELIEIATDACGLPVQWDEDIDQPTLLDEIEPPAPLDWSCREAPPELDSLLARIGWCPVISWTGSYTRVFRLPKPGESMTPPAWVTDNAEPYQLASGLSLRGKTVVVHGGDTRSVAVLTLDMTNLEWVWFDERTRRWLNDAETASLYPSETQPGSISAFTSPSADPARAKERSRLFRAVRIIPAALREKVRRMVPFPGVSGGAVPVAGTAAVVESGHCIEAGAGQIMQRAIARLDGARTFPADGVIQLPGSVYYVFLGAFKQSAIKEALALDVDGDKTRLKVTIAFEVEGGTFSEQTYWSAWRCSSSGGATATVTRLTGTDADNAIANGSESVYLRYEWLQRLGTAALTPPSTLAYTWTNTTELHAAAERIALARSSASELAPTGQIVLRGWHDRLPGVSWAWASRIDYVLDGPDRNKTIVTVGGHESLGGTFDAEELVVRRSFAAGMSRFAMAGSAAAIADTRLGGAPGSADVPSLRSPGSTGLPVSTRGSEGRLSGQLGVSSAAGSHAASAGEQALGVGGGRTWLARITGASAIGGTTNRWEYTWSEVSLNNDRTYSTPSGGRTNATTGYGKAINLLELTNSASGMQGNQVTIAELGTMTIGAVDNAVVEMSGPFGASDAPFCIFSAANGLRGDC